LLESVRVVDGSAGIAGAYCAKLFGDAGAEVVMAEPPDGAPLRAWSCGGTVPDGENGANGDDGALFRYLHHGHRSVVVADGADLDQLVVSADVVVTDPGGVLGDPSALADRHPGLVVVSVSPYGLTGPYAHRPASELTIQAESGGLAIRGRPEGVPFQAGGQISEWVTGAYAAAGGLGALRHAERTGRGELVDVSWYEVANLTLTLFADLFDSLRGRPDLDGTGAPPARSVETPSIEPTRDGFVGFNTNTRQQFEDFLALIERPDLLAEDPSWALLATRSARWDEWNAIVHAWTTAHTTDEIVERAALLRIPVCPVTDAPMVLGLDQAVARGVFVDDPTGSFRMPRRPWTIDGEPPPAPEPAPRRGEHTATLPPRPRPRPRPHARTQPPATEEHPVLPLTGTTVLDLTSWWAGPSATHALAAMGAEVLHVESVRHIDGVRMTGGVFHDRPQWWERSAFFLQTNANKAGITLDLSTPRGRELLLGLVADADADLVVENFTPRVLEAFDLGWDVIHAANPATVMVRMPAFGLDGPWRDRPGFAQTMEQVTGLAWLTGHPDDQPRIQRGPCDPNAGMHAAFAALVGLARRDRTGSGCLVEVPMFDAALAVAAEPVLEWTAYGNRLGRDGNRSPRAAPQGLYACRGHERWLALSVLDDGQWAALAGVLGGPTWADDPALATAAGRGDRHDDLDRHLGEWAARQDLDEAVAALVAAGVPAAPARDPRRTAGHPQSAARGFTEPVDHPVAGRHAIQSLPFRFRSVERWIRTPAPTLGQHTREVLAKRLGCTDDELDALTESQVIGTWPAGL
jgi:crotonobetainyl-CoA:carnitine CoA-transferase CaiB-like acyl-CoA transferase